MKTPKSIFVLGRRWFHKLYGNTYHSVQIVVDGKTVHQSKMEYGYGDQYLWTANSWLADQGYINPEKFPNGSMESLWRTCERLGITFDYSVVDVSRRKDL